MRTLSVIFSLSDRGAAGGRSADDDTGLVRGFLDGGERDFDLLVNRYKEMVFNLCLNITGDYDEAVDCSQEVFIKMYRNLGRFEFRSSLSTWLYSIALNTCRTHLSSSYKKKVVPIDGVENSHTSGKESNPDYLFERSEGERAVREALAKLPDDERILVVFRDLEEKSYDEIAAITGVKEGTIKSRLSRGRRRLRGLLEGVMS